MNQPAEFNRLVTAIPAGRCIKISTSGSNILFIPNYPGHHFDRNWNVVETRSWGPNDPRWATVRLPRAADYLLRRTLGLYYIGILRSVEMWEMAWNEWEHAAEKSGGGFTKDLKLRTRKEKTRYFYLSKFQYAFGADNVETSSGIRVEAKFSIFVAGCNPWTALVDNDDWFAQLEEVIQARFRDYIGGSDFFELLSEDPNARANLLASHPLLVQLSSKAKVNSMGAFSDYMAETMVKDDRKSSTTKGKLIPIKEALGVEILDARIRDISLKESDKLNEKLSGVIIAEIERQEEMKRLEAEAAGIERRGKAVAEAENLLTEAKRKRLAVDKEYMATPEGAAVLATEKQGDAYRSVAASLGGKESKVTNLVMPQNAPIVVTKAV